MDLNNKNTQRYGTENKDYLYVPESHTSVFGMGGDDNIISSKDYSILNGGLGNDVLQIHRKASYSTLYGNEGNDTLNAFEGKNNKLFGGEGNDNIYASSDFCILDGGNGNDTLESRGNNNVLLGGAGDDILEAYNGSNIILDGGKGADKYRIQTYGETTLHIDNLDDKIIYMQPGASVNLVISVSGYKMPANMTFKSVTYIDGARPLDYHIDSIDSGLEQGYLTHKFKGYTSDEGITVYYTFADTADHGERGFRQYSTIQIQDIEIALQQYSNVSNVRFVRTNDPKVADFKFYLDDLTESNTYSNAINSTANHFQLCNCSGCLVKNINPENHESQLGEKYITSGYAYYGGDIHLNSELYSHPDSFKYTKEFDGWTLQGPGSGYDVLLHEVGHSLGLKHTGNYSFTAQGPFLPDSEENTDFSVMSYRGRTEKDTWINQGLQDFDLATLHYKYGVNKSARAGNDTYDITKNMYIWDGSGNDTISAENATAGTYINLTPGSWNHVDTKQDLLSARGQSFLGYNIDIENATGSQYDDVLIGNKLSNTLVGGAGNDILKGGEGYDVLIGGTGHDNYYLFDDKDLLVENPEEGIDFVRISGKVTHYQLLDNFERIVSEHKAGIDTHLIGNSANNILYSGLSNDVMDGLSGIDGVSYADVDNVQKKGVNVDLSINTAQDTNHGVDTILNIENLYGSNYHDVLKGNDDNNYIQGGLGHDVLIGRAGNDYLNGGEGQDLLIGGEGYDIFVFTSEKDSSRDINLADVIQDFESGFDKIDLSSIDADVNKDGDQAFTAMIGANEIFTKAGQMRFVNGVLYGNNDNDSEADFAIHVANTEFLQPDDFIL